MQREAPIIVIGSALWDVVGRAERRMAQGHDVPGRITRIPGGVALNIAMALRRAELEVSLLSAVGADPGGSELVGEIQRRGIDTRHLHVSPDHPTDQYMAIEGANGLIAAIADCHSLEDLADAVIAPLRDGRLGDAARPFEGTVVLEGNLPEAALAGLAADPALARADIRLAPASPGKARRLAPFLTHPRATAYLNLIEARLLLGREFGRAEEAARALAALGLGRAIVTDGPNPVAVAAGAKLFSARPRAVKVRRVTGAGDVFMAGHMAAEARGAGPEEALDFALEMTADYISGEEPL